MTGPVETQPERTVLAWQRTGLGLLAVAGLVGHRAVHLARPALLLLAGVAALLGLVVLGGLSPARYRQVRRRLAADEAVASPAVARAATATVALTALAAAAAVVIPG
ncbi:DUF202 domain-containing protein [Blastococcus sp. SYSU DS0533]